MLDIKRTSLIASLVLAVSPLANADTYSLSGGLTRVYSSTFKTEVGISPNPSGIASGTFDVEVNPSTGFVRLGDGDHFVLADFVGTVNALGSVTTFDAVATEVTVHNPVSGTLDANRHINVTSTDMQPSVSVDTDFQNCSGIACLAIEAVVLDLKNYTVDITFNADYSSFEGTFKGVTNNGSKVEVLLIGVKQ